jgi:hypothetical protein
MAQFYLSDDRQLLIRRARTEDPPEMPAWSYLDRDAGDWLPDPEVGRQVILGDAYEVDETTANGLVAAFRPASD